MYKGSYRAGSVAVKMLLAENNRPEENQSLTLSNPVLESFNQVRAASACKEV